MAQERFVCPLCGVTLSNAGFSGHVRMKHSKTTEEAAAIKATARKLPADVPQPEAKPEAIPTPATIPDVKPIEQPIAQSQRLPEPIIQPIQGKEKPRPSIAVVEDKYEKEDLEMDVQEVNALIAETVAKVMADRDARDKAAAELERKKQEARERAKEKASKFHNTIDAITNNINSLTQSIKTVKGEVAEELAGTISPKIDDMVATQQGLREDMDVLKSKLPENFCSEFPDLCRRMSKMEKVVNSSGSFVKENGIHDAAAAFECKDCRDAFLKEAKKYLPEIVGDDTETLAKLTEGKGFVVTKKVQKKVLDF